MKYLLTRISLILAILYIGWAAYNEVEIYMIRHVYMEASDDGELSKAKLEDLTRAVEVLEGRRLKLYPWAEMPQVIAYIILASACGAFGGLVRDVHTNVFHPNRKPKNWILLGLVLGPPTLIFAVPLQTLIGKLHLPETTLLILSVTFAAGLVSQEAYAFLTERAKKIFNPKTDP